MGYSWGTRGVLLESCSSRAPAALKGTRWGTARGTQGVLKGYCKGTQGILEGTRWGYCKGYSSSSEPGSTAGFENRKNKRKKEVASREAERRHFEVGGTVPVLTLTRCSSGAHAVFQRRSRAVPAALTRCSSGAAAARLRRCVRAARSRATPSCSRSSTRSAPSTRCCLWRLAAPRRHDPRFLIDLDRILTRLQMRP
jgi:hypothetical protein